MAVLTYDPTTGTRVAFRYRLGTRSLQVRFGLWTVPTMKHGVRDFPKHSRSSKARHRLNHSQTPTELQIAYLWLDTGPHSASPASPDFAGIWIFRPPPLRPPTRSCRRAPPRAWPRRPFFLFSFFINTVSICISSSFRDYGTFQVSDLDDRSSQRTRVYVSCGSPAHAPSSPREPRHQSTNTTLNIQRELLNRSVDAASCSKVSQWSAMQLPAPKISMRMCISFSETTVRFQSPIRTCDSSNALERASCGSFQNTPHRLTSREPATPVYTHSQAPNVELSTGIAVGRWQLLRRLIMPAPAATAAAPAAVAAAPLQCLAAYPQRQVRDLHFVISS